MIKKVMHKDENDMRRCLYNILDLNLRPCIVPPLHHSQTLISALLSHILELATENT